MNCQVLSRTSKKYQECWNISSETIVCGFECYFCWYLIRKNGFEKPRTKKVGLNAKSLEKSNLKIYCTGKEQSQNYGYLLRLSILVKIFLPCLTLILASFINRFA